MSEILPGAGNVIYEVDLDADAAIEGPFDTWLRDHIADLLQFPGFLSAEVLADAAPRPGRIRRTVQYRLRDEAALDDYLGKHAPRMRAQGAALFGDRYTASRRVLAHREEFIRGAVSTENCLNCGEVLTGQHCAHCGQRARVRVLSLWGMTRDLLGDFIDWDARIWRTLRPLAFQPGRLTQEYLRGRRASYTPPFRMYILLSVAFFLIASVGGTPGSDLHFKLDGKGNANLQVTGDGPATAGTAAPPPPAATPAPAQLDAETKRLMANPCTGKTPAFKVNLFGRSYEPQLRQACSRIWSDTPSFGKALFQNLPKMMFIFLPLIAVAMYVLYIGSGRYYVEHLLFVVHYHAFFFLGGIAILLAERAAWLAPGTTFARGGEFMGRLLTTAFAVYAPVYLYLAMRRVYGQGRIVTFAKYSALGIAYLVCMTITIVGLLFYTALTL